MLRLYLDDELRSSVIQGNHNFFNILIKTFKAREIAVELCPNTIGARQKSAALDGYSLFHLENPFHPNALDLRLAYMYPFWRIEKARRREDYLVAQKKFDPKSVIDGDVKRFFRHWQSQMLKANWQKVDQSGFVFIPLQGRLLDQRHGQVMPPIEMIKATLKHDPTRQVIVKFHPNEAYTDQEKRAVHELAKQSRLSIEGGDMNALLAGCDYVVTENSSVAFKGILHKKPAILFSKSDFHHIFQDATQIGIGTAFEKVMAERPDYEKYFFWFLQENCINAGKSDAGQKIVNLCQQLGWEI